MELENGGELKKGRKINNWNMGFRNDEQSGGCIHSACIFNWQWYECDVSIMINRIKPYPFNLFNRHEGPK